ncbi:hypothetical protein B0O80DRAFT_58430 [Mortierella sp. GBAus27b]|nr:hypothetical protein B0O80DRAFT_58430 [Mortierella sp. GBAus27b]
MSSCSSPKRWCSTLSSARRAMSPFSTLESCRRCRSEKSPPRRLCSSGRLLLAACSWTFAYGCLLLTACSWPFTPGCLLLAVCSWPFAPGRNADSLFPRYSVFASFVPDLGAVKLPSLGDELGGHVCRNEG